MVGVGKVSRGRSVFTATSRVGKDGGVGGGGGGGGGGGAHCCSAQKHIPPHTPSMVRVQALMPKEKSAPAGSVHVSMPPPAAAEEEECTT